MQSLKTLPVTDGAEHKLHFLPPLPTPRFPSRSPGAVLGHRRRLLGEDKQEGSVIKSQQSQRAAATVLSVRRTKPQQYH